MTDPAVVTIEPADTAVVRAVVPMTELAGFFDRTFGVLPGAIAKQGATIAGPAFALYHGAPGDKADLEVGFPTDRAIEPDGDVVASTLPGGRIARVVHAGGYDGLGGTWERLAGWMAEQGLAPGHVLWEVYVTEPSPDMNPDDLRTELNWPVG